MEPASPGFLYDSLERPLRDLRISVTDRCNFRCGYCMPVELYGERYHFLPKAEILSFEEIRRLARIAIDLGVRKIRITGGEPLLRADLPDLIAMLAELPGLEDLALTTNGYRLPVLAEPLQDAGLQRISVSLDSLNELAFQHMNGGTASVTHVLQGIEAARKAGFSPIKINCVVQRGSNDSDLAELARYFKNSDTIVRFIEFMDVGTLNRWDLSKVMPAREILETLQQLDPLEPIEARYDGEVARRYRYSDGEGEIGIISSVTAPFCRGCTRLRLTPDGHLATCLFATETTDLKGPLRCGESDAQINQRIREIWSQRRNRYSEERSDPMTIEKTADRATRMEMYRLGG